MKGKRQKEKEGEQEKDNQTRGETKRRSETVGFVFEGRKTLLELIDSILQIPSLPLSSHDVHREEDRERAEDEEKRQRKESQAEAEAEDGRDEKDV